LLIRAVAGVLLIVILFFLWRCYRRSKGKGIMCGSSSARKPERKRDDVEDDVEEDDDEDGKTRRGSSKE
jgi:hypothetical protein